MTTEFLIAHGAVLTREGAQHFERVEQRLDICERALTLILSPHGEDVSERIRDIAESALLPAEREA